MLQASTSCKRVGPRQDQADNNADLRDRLNVWPLVADSMMARAKAHRKAEYTNATAPVLPGLKQTRHQDEKDGIKCREAAASHIHAVKG